MAMKTAKLWGLVVPGRPPTPSEGHAQNYARIGPVNTQRLIAFDNGTCLSFGPDDLVDEFGPQDAFAEQVALVDKAIRDCQAVTHLYPSMGNDDNRLYDDFRNKPLDLTKLVRLPQTWAIHYRIPSKLASLGTVIPVYAAQMRRKDWPGAAHPGTSVDTRFGVTGHPGPNTIQDQIRRDSDKDRQSGSGWRGEQRVQPHFRGNRSTRRGRRGGRCQGPEDEEPDRADVNNRGELRMGRGTHSSSSATSHQQPNQANAHHPPQAHQYRQPIPNNAQNSIVCANIDQGVMHSNHLQDLGEMQMFSNGQYGDDFNKFSRLPPPGIINYNGIYPPWRFNRTKWQILADAREAGSEGQFSNHVPEHDPSISRNAILWPSVNNEQVLNHHYESQEQYVEAYFGGPSDWYDEQARMTEERMRIEVAAQNQGPIISSVQSQTPLDGGMPFGRGPFEGRMQERGASYTQRHEPTVRQGDQELARYADQLNQLPPHLYTGRLQGDAFVGASVLPTRNTSQTESVLAAMAQQQVVFHHTQGQQSIGSYPSKTRTDEDLSNDGFIHSNLKEPAESSEASVVGDDGTSQHSRGRRRPVRRSSARARAADERRAGSGGKHTAQPRAVVQLDTTVLAPSGIYSREPSPMPQRSGRFFDRQSRMSSPGVAHHGHGHGQGSFDRSASEGNF